MAEESCTVIVLYEVGYEDSKWFREMSGRLVPFPIHASAYEVVRT